MLDPLLASLQKTFFGPRQICLSDSMVATDICHTSIDSGADNCS